MGTKIAAWIGIDPGATGAAGLIDAEGTLHVFDWPGDPGPVVDQLREWLCEYRIQLCALEKVSSRPGQGVKSVFTFGTNYGTWQGILSALSVPFILVAPRQWQKGIVAPSAGPTPKERSLSVARALFPDADLSLKKHHGRADALLLTYYARRETIGR